MVRIHLLLVCALAWLGSVGVAAGFVPDDQVVSDPAASIVDPEFDRVGSRMVWQDEDDNLWLADVDPDTGAILPPSGRGRLLDTRLAAISETGNGPEWAYGSDGTYVVYTKRARGGWYLAAAREDRFGGWSTRLLYPAVDRFRPIGTPPSNTQPARVVYIRDSSDTKGTVAWREINDRSTERQARIAAQGGRWVENERAFVGFEVIDGVAQAVLVAIDGFKRTQLTFDADNKTAAIMWLAPEYGELLLMTLLNTTQIGIYRQVGGQWTRLYTFAVPSAKPFMSSPEPFVSGGRSYVSLVAASQLQGNPPFLNTPVGPTEIWVAGIDPANPFFRRVDDPAHNALRMDPEAFDTTNGTVVYYSEVNALGRRVLRRAATGLPAEAAATTSEPDGY
jgi:hypothetical protein